MASIHPFRQSPWASSRKLSTPRFPQAPRLRLRGLGRYFGFILLAAVMAAGLIALTRGPDPDAGRKSGRTDTQVIRWWNIHVVDGDTLRIGNERIRLLGIDAPELSQTCRDAKGSAWACGGEASARLKTLAAADLTCTRRGLDRYGRTLAICRAGGVDVGETLVREGLAVSYGDYWFIEQTARLARRGIWQGDFVRPQDWRKRQPYGN